MEARYLNMVHLPPYWEKFRPHSGQSRLWRSKSRFKIVPAGRGSGKTALAKKYLARWLSNAKRWHDAKYFFALPTYKQAKRVAWFDLINSIPKEWIQGKPNVSDMVIETIFGSRLYVVGLDSPQRLEGVQWDGGVIDECCDQALESFLYTGVMPALAHKNAWLWLIGVPKRSGEGSHEFKSLYDQGVRGACLEGTDDRIESFTWRSDTVLSDEQLAFFKHHMDERDYEEQFNATWQTLGGAIFYAFDEAVHVKADVQYNPDLPICVCSDFNVNPMCWCLAQIHDNVIHFFDEVFIRNTNTPETLDILDARYGHHKAGFQFYGDSTARSRRPSAEFTDYAYISDDMRFDNPVKKRIYYLAKNPSVADRFSACNSMLKNAAGDVRCYISPKCKRLIKDLRSRSYRPGTRDADDIKDSDLGHMSDAFGYCIFRLFPVKLNLNVGKSKVSVSSNNRISHLMAT